MIGPLIAGAGLLGPARFTLKPSVIPLGCLSFQQDWNDDGDTYRRVPAGE